MDIAQLTSHIDSKLLQLQQQIEHLRQQLAGASSDQQRLNLQSDLKTLEQLQRTLSQARSLALRAHHQTQTGHSQIAEKRLLALALCAFSALSLVLLAIIAYLQ